ncbi:hypothetical protein LINPERHAP2_LOCUS22962, partial [Linum perenne]
MPTSSYSHPVQLPPSSYNHQEQMPPSSYSHPAQSFQFLITWISIIERERLKLLT